MIPDEVKKGMELLDREVPGWRERIDLDKLHMGDCFQCVLGQVFDEFNKGLESLDLTEDEGDKHGFDKWGNPFVISYAELTAAWKEALS